MKEVFDPKSHIGETHGIYKIVDMGEKDRYGHYIYTAECTVCGYKIYGHYGKIKSRNKCEAKCKHKDIFGNIVSHLPKNYNERLRNIYYDIAHRCYNINDVSYKWYGAKGIKLSDEWYNNYQAFESWSFNNGYADNLTIDRIDPTKDYSPDNCRWITLEENSRRAGKVNWITVDNLTLTGRQWSEKLNLGINRINIYLRNNGLETTTKLIKAILNNPDRLKTSKNVTSLLELYNIE